MIARRLNGTTADMYYHAVPAPASNPDPIIGQRSCRMYGTNMDLSSNWIFQSEKCNSVGTYYQVLLLLTSRIIFRITWMGTNPQCLDERIIFMSMLNDIEWTKKGNTEQVLHTANEVAARCDPIHARRRVLPGARVRKYVVECKFQRTSRTMGYCRIARGWPTTVSYFPPDISSDRAMIAWTVGERNKQYPFPWYFRKQEGIPRPYWQAIYIVFTIEFASGTRLKNQILRPRTAEDEEQIDLELEQLTLITQKKKQTMTQARGDSVLLTSFRTGSICQNGGERTIHQCFCHGPKQLFSFMQRVLRTKNFSEF